MKERPSLSAVLRDAVAYLGGWLLMFKQAGIGFAPPVQVSDTIVWAASLLIGVPGLAQLWAWKAGTGTGQQHLPLPHPPSSSPSTPPSER